jgi:hypothetical protein
MTRIVAVALAIAAIPASAGPPPSRARSAEPLVYGNWRA